MAVTLRLARHGQKKRPYYRIVAAEKQARRDGRFIEIIGNYDPTSNPPKIVLKEDRVKRWISNGAIPSASVATIIKKNIPGLLEEKTRKQKEKIVAARKQRKARSAQKGGEKSASKKTAKAPAKPRKSAKK